MAFAKRYHHGDLKNTLIQAGIQVLSEHGLEKFSLRRVARQAGVSHSAPYAHFSDKQALIAAISTEGFNKLYQQLSSAIAESPANPARQLARAVWAYRNFALNDTDHFKVTFATSLDNEGDYPAFSEISSKNFELVVGIVKDCQAAGVLKQGAPEVLAVSIWGSIHGIITLFLNRQISLNILDRYPLETILVEAINQISLVELKSEDFFVKE
jgi:AcrR family transcriptional regulator